MQLTEETARELNRNFSKVAKQLSTLTELLKAKSEQWVKVTVIMRMTGWDKTELRRAKLRGEITCRKDENGIWYDANSLMPVHILNKQERDI